jgi:5-methylcytosine-specific restriction endonuclease McrA
VYKDREKYLAYQCEYNKKNKDAIAERKAGYYKANKDRIDAYRVKNKQKKETYRAANKEKAASRSAEYYAANKPSYRARETRHKKAVSEQYAALSEDEKWMLQEAYELAKLREKVCGGKWEVDHIVPLSKGGLHSPYNVQVVPAAWNRSKHASHSRRMFGAQE